jgi:hypothetical protein
MRTSLSFLHSPYTVLFSGQSALHAAIESHEVQVVETLLAAKADPNMKNG